MSPICSTHRCGRYGLNLGIDSLEEELKAERVLKDIDDERQRKIEEEEAKKQQERFLRAMDDNGGSACSLYSVLGVDVNCTPRELRKAYQRMALRTHPDKNRADPEGAKVRFQQVGLAYEILSDPDSRASYNQDPEGFLKKRNGGADGGVDVEVRMAQQFLKEGTVGNSNQDTLILLH